MLEARSTWRNSMYVARDALTLEQSVIVFLVTTAFDYPEINLVVLAE